MQVHGSVHVDSTEGFPHINWYPSFCEIRGAGGFWYEVLAVKLIRWDPDGATKKSKNFYYKKRIEWE